MSLEFTINASNDETTRRIRADVLPFAAKSLENTRFVDYMFRKSVLSKISDSKGYYEPMEHIVLTLSFDTRTCGVPISHCNGHDNCDDCYYNPLIHLFDPYVYGEPLVVTSRYTINALLDTITILTKANTNSLFQLEHMKNNNDKNDLFDVFYDE
jgi:hypothetical protein